MQYFWKKRHTLWLVQTVLSQHQDDRVLQLLTDTALVGLKEAQRLLNHVQTLLHWYVTKKQTHFNIINVSQCRNNTN